MVKKGFTLIELLVVISVISVMATIVLSSVNSARKKAETVRYKQDLRNIQKALELYRFDNNTYPVQNGWLGVSSNFGSAGVTGAGGYIPNLAPNYISELPIVAGSASTTSGGYLYRGGATGYKILLHMHTNFGLPTPTSSDVFYDAVRPTWSWMVCVQDPGSNWCNL